MVLDSHSAPPWVRMRSPLLVEALGIVTRESFDFFYFGHWIMSPTTTTLNSRPRRWPRLRSQLIRIRSIVSLFSSTLQNSICSFDENKTCGNFKFQRSKTDSVLRRTVSRSVKLIRSNCDRFGVDFVSMNMWDWLTKWNFRLSFI